jgi:hypothetical protein
MALAPSTTSRLRVVWALDAYMMRPRWRNGKTLAIHTNIMIFQKHCKRSGRKNNGGTKTDLAKK